MEIKQNLYVPDVEPLFKQNITNLLQRLVRCQSLSFPTKGPSPPPPFRNVFLTIAIDVPFFSPVHASRLPRTTRVFCLRSVNLLRKYSLVLDLPMSFLLSPVAFVASPSDWARIQRAMAQHGTQYLWFRKLYMAFSR